jgi:hypothetical protein
MNCDNPAIFDRETRQNLVAQAGTVNERIAATASDRAG